MAPHAGPVRDLGQRSDVAADAGRHGDPVLGALDGEVSDGDGARGRTARRRARAVGGARVLRARTIAARRREGDRFAVRRQAAFEGERAARDQGHRAVHRGCDRVDRARRTSAARRRQRGARAVARVRDVGGHQVHRGQQGVVESRRRADDGAAGDLGTRRSQSGLDGARRDAVLAHVTAMLDLPARGALCGTSRGQDGSTAGDRTAQEAGSAPGTRANARLDRGRSRRTRTSQARWLVRRAVGAAGSRADRTTRRPVRRRRRGIS